MDPDVDTLDAWTQMIFDRKKHACLPDLLEGYGLLCLIDLQNNVKTALAVNGAAIAAAVILAVIGNFIIPMATALEGEMFSVLLRLGVMVICVVVYIVLHELTHGAAMRYYGSKTVKYGLTGKYAYTGSSEYYDKASYIVITLAPVVLWGIVLAVVCACVPSQWFWTFFFVQITNLSGAAGDAYVTYKLIRLPDTIRISDSGVAMKVYGLSDK